MPSQSEENRRVRILIVDDDPSQRSLLHSFLKVQGFQTAPVGSGEEALRQLAEQRFDMMISDVRMPGISGLETMRRARAAHATMPILLVTAYADIREAVGAMRDGALNYLSKPIDLDELLASVRHAIGLSRTAPVAFQDKPLPVSLVAQSPLMQSVLRDASLVAPSDTRVLITGESGVGKELVAELIHAWSSRAREPLVKVSCAAMPEPQLERELFGQDAGSGAGGAQRLGAFERASNGVVLLDEIGDLSAALQAKLLRVTQDGHFQRIGSSAGMCTHARILASTNRDIEEEVKRGVFREDLFYRLNVVELNIPPLRERREDIIPLAIHFLAGLTNGRARLSPSASAVLQGCYAWPGNARELRNAMERAALLSGGELILADHLPARVRTEGATPPPAEGADAGRLQEMEEQAILNALRKHDFNRTDTARALGISRRGLLYKLQHLRERGHNVDPE